MSVGSGGVGGWGEGSEGAVVGGVGSVGWDFFEEVTSVYCNTICPRRAKKKL